MDQAERRLHLNSDSESDTDDHTPVADLPTIRQWRSTNAQYNAKIRTFTMDVQRIVNSRLSSTGADMHMQQLDIQGHLESLDFHRTQWEEKFWRELGTIRKAGRGLGFFQSREDEDANLGHIQKLLERFKASNREDFTRLASLEADLSQTLENVGDTIDSWEAYNNNSKNSAVAPPWRFPGNETQRQLRAAKHQKQQRKREEEILGIGNATRLEQEANSLKDVIDALDAEIEHAGGLTGGWRKDDHEIFMSLSRTCRGGGGADPRFHERCALLLPHITQGRVSDHIVWHREHEKRLKLKRELLAKWKKEKVDAKKRDEQTGAWGAGRSLKENSDPRGAANRLKLKEWERKKVKPQVTEAIPSVVKNHQNSKSLQKHEQKS